MRRRRPLRSVTVGDWGLYLAFLIPPLLLGLGVQWWLKKTFAEQAKVQVSNGMTGAEIARAVLDANDLHEVPVDMRERSSGESKLVGKKALLLVLTVIGTLFAYRRVRGRS